MGVKMTVFTGPNANPNHNPNHNPIPKIITLNLSLSLTLTISLTRSRPVRTANYGQWWTVVVGRGPTKRRMGTHWTAWTRIEAHGRARRRMDAHDGKRTCSSRSRLQSRDVETLNWGEQEAFEDDSRQRDEEQCRMDAHAGEWKRIQHMDTNCNTMQWTRCRACAGRTARCYCASLYINK